MTWGRAAPVPFATGEPHALAYALSPGFYPTQGTMPQTSAAQTSAALAATKIREDLEQLDRLKQSARRLQDAFVASYRRLWDSRLLREDARAVALLKRMGAARSTDDLEASVRALANHVAHLGLLSGGRSPTRRAAPKLRLLSAEDLVGDPAPRRTFLRL